MSRFGDYDDYPDYPNASDLWEANLRRALAGKRGKKALAELREALLALPERRLIAGALCTVGADRLAPQAYSRGDLEEKIERDGEGGCAIGAYVWYRKVKAGMDPQAAFAELPTLLDVVGNAEVQTAEAGKRAGLTFTLAQSLAYRNDEEFGGMTPEVRYRRFMEWIDHQLSEEVHPLPTVRALRVGTLQHYRGAS